MTDGKRQAFLEKPYDEDFARMTPFERYLFDTGQFDEVIRPVISDDDVFTEPCDLCLDAGCEHCIGYSKEGNKATHMPELTSREKLILAR